jgi:hypothetical protein
MKNNHPLSNDQDYSYRWVKISYYLHTLSRECRIGQIHVAQNTIEDLLQEWSYQDLLAKTSTNELIVKYHYPSDSLQILDSLVSSDHFPEKQIVLEIKRINGKIDSMLDYMHQGKKQR